MPVLRPSGSDFTSFVKAAAQYVQSGTTAKVTKSGGGSMLAPPSLGATARASLVAIRADPASSVLSIPSIPSIPRVIPRVWRVTTFASSANGLSTVSSVAVLPGGNLAVTDPGNHRIVIITPSSVVTTLAGTSVAAILDATGTSARFNSPSGIAVLLDGNIVVADQLNNRIRVVTYPGGVVTTLAGSGATGTAGSFADGTGAAAAFYYPQGVAVLPDGNIVVGDKFNNRIRVVTYPGGVVTTLAGNTSGYGDGTGAGASFNFPSAVAVTLDGNIVVADTSNGSIRLVTYPGGVVTTLIAPGGVSSPQGLAVLPDGNIVVGDYGNNRILLLTYPGGVVTTIAGSIQSFADGIGTAAYFNQPTGIAAIQTSGKILVADRNNNKIRLISYELP